MSVGAISGTRICADPRGSEGVHRPRPAAPQVASTRRDHAKLRETAVGAVSRARGQIRGDPRRSATKIDCYLSSSAAVTVAGPNLPTTIPAARLARRAASVSVAPPAATAATSRASAGRSASLARAVAPRRSRRFSWPEGEACAALHRICWELSTHLSESRMVVETSAPSVRFGIFDRYISTRGLLTSMALVVLRPKNVPYA